MKFNKGDVVILKSGGPKMTIQEIRIRDSADLTNESGRLVVSSETYTYLCRWFSRGAVQNLTFDEDVLELAV